MNTPNDIPQSDASTPDPNIMTADSQQRLRWAIRNAVSCGVTNLKSLKSLPGPGFPASAEYSALYGATSVVLTILLWGDDTWIEVRHKPVAGLETIRLVMNNETGELIPHNCQFRRESL